MAVQERGKADPFLMATLFSIACLIVAAALIVFSQKAHGDRLRFVVDRSDDTIDLYFSVPAETLVDVFGLQPSDLLDADGSLDFDRLRNGTADVGDRLLENVHSSMGGSEIEFETMSLMIHPIKDKLPLNNPIHGMVAIEVCTSEDPDLPSVLSQFQAYSGFTASTMNQQGTLRIRLPNGIGERLQVLVRDHTDGSLQRAYLTEVSENGILLLPGTEEVTALDRLVDWRGVVFGAI